MPAGLPRRRSHRWIGFFVVLAVLGAAAVVIPIVYNLSIQLKPEQLADARRRWRDHAPADYDLEYLVKSEQGGVAAMDREYFVRIRGGRVVLVVDTGEVMHLDPSLSAVAGPAPLGLVSDDPERYGVAALFDEIERALRQDEAGGRRNFATASFDPRDGHPFHYVHRVRGTKDRVEWNVKLTRATGEPGASAPGGTNSGRRRPPLADRAISVLRPRPCRGTMGEVVAHSVPSKGGMSCSRSGDRGRRSAMV